MKLFNKYFSKFGNSIYILFNSVLDRGIFFILYVFLAHSVSKTEYGFIITVFAFTNILQGIFDLGLPFYIQREIAGGTNFSAKINSILYIKLISLFLYVPVPIIYFALSSDVNIILVIIISIINFCWGISGIFNAVFYGSNTYKESSIYLLISRTILIITFLILIFTNTSTEILLLSFVLSFLVHLKFFKTHLKNRGIKLFKDKIKINFFGKDLKSSIPMGLGVIFVLIYDRADILILQKVSGLEIVAFYAVAYSLYRSLQVFITMVLIPKYTAFSKSFSSGRALNRNEVIHTLLFLIAVGCIIITILNIFPNILIRIFYTSSYLPSGRILKYLAWGFGGVLLNNYTGVILNSIRKEKIPAVSTGIGAFINVILNIILILKMGVWGAVITTVITEYFVFILQLSMLLYYKKKNILLLN